jgi:hypothetical protein
VMVEVPCACCCVVTTFVFGSRHDQVVCRGCERHQGDTVAKLRQRDYDHVQLWKSEVALINEAQSDAVAALTVKMAERDHAIEVLNTKVEEQRELLKAELRKAPEATARAWFDSEAIRRANEEVQRSYRSRNHALRAMWDVDRIHRGGEKRDDYCTCGEKAEGCCAVSTALDPVRDMLYRWEDKELERLEAGLDHGLPRHHPRVIALRRQGARYIY